MDAQSHHDKPKPGAMMNTLSWKKEPLKLWIMMHFLLLSSSVHVSPYLYSLCIDKTTAITGICKCADAKEQQILPYCRNFHPNNCNFINLPNHIGSGLITQTMIVRMGSTSLLMIHAHFSLWEEKINRRKGWCLQIGGEVQAKWCSFLLCCLTLATELAPGDFSIGLADTLQGFKKKKGFVLGSFI